MTPGSVAQSASDTFEDRRAARCSLTWTLAWRAAARLACGHKCDGSFIEGLIVLERVIEVVRSDEPEADLAHSTAQAGVLEESSQVESGRMGIARREEEAVLPVSDQVR